MTARDASLRRAARISVAVGLLILVLKVSAWLATGSTAVLSDAIESVVHVLATVVMLATLQISQQPPDRDHPYGHGKAASFSVGFEGGLVAFSGVLVLIAVIDRVMSGRTMGDLTYGLAGTIAAAAVNLALGLYLIKTGKAESSEIIVADGQHVMADVWTSVGVVLGLVLVAITGLQWIDWVVATIVALHLLMVGTGLLRSGIAGLMDRVDEADYGLVVDAVNGVRDPAWSDMHDLRLRRVGDLCHVDFHLVVPGAWTIRKGHDTTELIETKVLAALGVQGTVLVHLDYAAPPPLGAKKAAVDLVQPAAPFTIAGALRGGPFGREHPRSGDTGA